MSSISQRVQIIDVLRGFALLGILLVHTSGEFAGWSSTYINPHNASSLSTAKEDSVITLMVDFLFVNKSRTLFAFLFGIGFYYQLHKANKNGHRIETKFAKRMGALFIIGLLHAYLLWSGDILRLYVLCGLLLLFAYKWQPRTLLLVAFVCTIIVPAISSGIHLFFPHGVLTNVEKQTMYKEYAGNNYKGLLHANLLRDAAINLDPYSIGNYLLPIWGNFLFGFWSAQTSLIQKLMSHKKRLLLCLLISGVSAVFSSSHFFRVILKFLGTDEDSIAFGWRSLYTLPAAYSMEATAFFLMCFVVFLFAYTPCRRWLFFFTFAGRMTLTNYIMQSLFAVVFFFGVGFGFISHFGSTIAFCLGICFFIFQLMYSYVWLRFFTTGPVEYLWRTMIEGKRTTFRKQKPGIA